MSPTRLSSYLRRMRASMGILAVALLAVHAPVAGAAVDPCAGMTGTRVSVVLACAQTQIGTPYVSGRMVPQPNAGAGFDCSKFTTWVFYHVGVGLPALAQSQWDNAPHYMLPNGTPDSRQKRWLKSQGTPQPGDLVFFTGDVGGTNITHVGIYIGKGIDSYGVPSTDLYIHAPGSGMSVMKSHLLSGGSLPARYYGFARYL